MINVALIGAGAHSVGNHAPALQRYAAEHPDRARLAAVCDLDPARAQQAQERFGFARATTSIDVLFTEPLDALVTVFPYQIMRQAIPPLFARGLPMCIEKPLGTCLEDAQALADAAREAGMLDKVMVSLNRRHDPALTRAVAWLQGQPPFRYVRATMLRNKRLEPDFLWGTGIHVLDAVQHVAGPLTLRDARFPAGAGQACIARLQGCHGAEVTLEILPHAGEWQETILIVGDGYQVEINTGMLPPWRIRIVKGLKLQCDESSPQGEPGFVSNGTYAETTAFLDAVIYGRPLPSATLADALASSRLMAEIVEG